VRCWPPAAQTAPLLAQRLNGRHVLIRHLQPPPAHTADKPGASSATQQRQSAGQTKLTAQSGTDNSSRCTCRAPPADCRAGQQGQVTALQQHSMKAHSRYNQAAGGGCHWWCGAEEAGAALSRPSGQLPTGCRRPGGEGCQATPRSLWCHARHHQGYQVMPAAAATPPALPRGTSSFKPLTSDAS